MKTATEVMRQGQAGRPDGTATHHGTATPRHGGRRGRWSHFARHYLEMVVAMVVGMVVLGAAVRGVLAVTGLEYSEARYPVLASLEMAFNMSVGMVVWMRRRGHAWPGTLEMSAAMFAPTVAFGPLVWPGFLSGESLMVLTHLLMLPLMLVVMLRRRAEYGA